MTGNATFRGNCQVAVPSSGLVLRAHQPRARVPAAPHPRQHWSLPVFSVMAVVVGVKWHHATGVVCSLLTTRAAQRLSLSSLAVLCLFREMA